ncbi:hypothetical protein Tco_0727257 [Tanacetum coccineum]|uniref:Uncharacterized protein n=1 Tax=Tanacetum coccineum TaxID=301880 RepID=A0ABQ4YIU3_9ASTR
MTKWDGGGTCKWEKKKEKSGRQVFNEGIYHVFEGKPICLSMRKLCVGRTAGAIRAWRMKWSIQLKNSGWLLKSNQDGTFKQIDIEKFKLAIYEVDTKVKSLPPPVQSSMVKLFSIKGDHIEAKVVHELLCSMVERQVDVLRMSLCDSGMGEGCDKVNSKILDTICDGFLFLVGVVLLII